MLFYNKTMILIFDSTSRSYRSHFIPNFDLQVSVLYSVFEIRYILLGFGENH